MLFQLYDQSSPFNSTHHVLYPQNVDRVVTIDCDVTSVTLPFVYASKREKKIIITVLMDVDLLYFMGL